MYLCGSKILLNSYFIFNISFLQWSNRCIAVMLAIIETNVKGKVKIETVSKIVKLVLGK